MRDAVSGAWARGSPFGPGTRDPSPAAREGRAGRSAAPRGAVVQRGHAAPGRLGDDQPADPGSILRLVVSRIRKAVQPGCLIRRAANGAYRADPPAGALDKHKFEALLTEASRVSEPACELACDGPGLRGLARRGADVTSKEAPGNGLGVETSVAGSPACRSTLLSFMMSIHSLPRPVPWWRAGAARAGSPAAPASPGIRRT